MVVFKRTSLGLSFFLGGLLGVLSSWTVLASGGQTGTVPGGLAEETKGAQDEVPQLGDGKRLPAEVFHCHDGDTCRVKVAEGLWLNVRLAGIDAPEVAKARGDKKGQQYGNEAREYLNKMIKGRKIELRQVDLDPYNRPVVELFDKDSNINLQLIEEGYAEVYRGKTKRFDKSLYLKAEEKAQKAKKGIWSLSSYQSPKDFRQEQKR